MSSLADRFSAVLGALDTLAQRAERVPFGAATAAALREARAELLEDYRAAPTETERAQVLELARSFAERLGEARNAARAQYRAKLRELIDTLAQVYGRRTDFTGPSGERVPYLPVSDAERLIRTFGASSRFWLDFEVPDGAKQPRFIQNHYYAALGLLGRFDGEEFTPHHASYEPAPPSVARKASELRVVKAQETFAVLDHLARLAIHFDALQGAPTKYDVAEEATTEAFQELPQTLAQVAQGAGEALRPVADWGQGLVTMAAVGIAGLAVLYLVVRKG
jgi:hypothetical protein